MSHQLTTSNLIYTFFAIALWTLLLVVSRVILLVYAIDPWSFTFLQLISGGLLLIGLSTGGEAVDWSTIRRPSTWFYGVLRVTTSAAFTAALVHVSVVYAGFLGTINVVMAVLGVWMVFGRRPTILELPGHILIVGGILALIMLRFENGWRNPAVLLMFVSEIAGVGTAIIAERHPDNNSTNPRTRLRFSGVVLILTAAFFLILRIGQTVYAGAEAADLANMQINWPLWIAGLLVGIVLRGPAMHVSLQAIRLVGTEIYILAAALLPFIGWGFEAIAGRLGVMTPPPSSMIDVVLGVIIMGGAVLIFATRRWTEPNVSPAILKKK
ncbi:MAG: hypothetical protein AAGD96_03045 [Chloroflexota bacterium]